MRIRVPAALKMPFYNAKLLSPEVKAMGRKIFLT
jgi:hypothetical protein